MREGLLMGRPGAGKSAILDLLARHSGVRSGRSKRCRMAAATGSWPAVVLPLGRYRQIRIREVPGLADTPLPQAELRRQQSWALAQLAAGPALVLHVVDAGRVGELGPPALSLADRQLAQLGTACAPAYALVAAQMDRPWAAAGLRLLVALLQPAVVIPVSARTGQGFGTLLRFLRHRL